MAAMMRCLSSCLVATRMWRRTERASLEKKPSTRLSQEPCLGVKTKAQLALGCHHHLSSSADGGIEACSGRGIVLEAGEVEPPEVAVEVFCGDAAVGAQEGFEALVATVDSLDV